jgi:4-diphosphocytidyl-2-C-methyl-D-erythritol kinase
MSTSNLFLSSFNCEPIMADCKEQIESIGNALLVRAPAKINLTLLIAGKRPDGFHEIETIMAKVDLFDELLIEPADKKGIELICKGPHWAPQSKENLVYHACELLLNSTHQSADIKITLTKNIPAGSGLGSASSDAAAAIIGLNQYLNLSVNNRELSKLAPILGSDVAFFFGPPIALCTGKGEKVKKIEEKFDFSAFLLLPNVSVSTKRIYGNYSHDPDLYETLSGKIKEHIRKNRIDLAANLCVNMLEKDCFDLYKELDALKQKVESITKRHWCLSGSGSAMFCLLQNKDAMQVGGIKHKLDQINGCKSLIVRKNKW